MSRAVVSLKHADASDKPFGDSPPVLNPALPVLHPPRHKNWCESKFRLQAYTDQTCAPPLAGNFRMVKVAMTQGLWQIPLLETHEEFEEQLALQNPSPDSARLQRRLQHPRMGGAAVSMNVSQNLFSPIGASQFLQFQTGTPPDHPAMSSVPPVTNSQQWEQLPPGQTDFLSSTAAVDNTYDARLHNILDGVDDSTAFLQQHGMQLSSVRSSTVPGTVPPASTMVSSIGAPPVLGLGISTVTMTQDPDVASLSSAQHDCRGSHSVAASACVDTRVGMAAFQEFDYDDNIGGSSKRLCPDEPSSLSWYRRSNPDTYCFDVDCRQGPDSFFLFSILSSLVAMSSQCWLTIPLPCPGCIALRGLRVL
jgi:hypothetical protein